MAKVLQSGAFRFEVCSNSKPVDGSGHATMTLLVAVRRMVNKGASGVAGGVYSSVEESVVAGGQQAENGSQAVDVRGRSRRPGFATRLFGRAPERSIICVFPLHAR